jgi:hypothetical protein
MGNYTCCRPPPDYWDDPGALLYESQKVAAVKAMRQPSRNLHRLVNTLGIVSATLNNQAPQQGTDCTAATTYSLCQ